jgi:hypothetical protein
MAQTKDDTQKALQQKIVTSDHDWGQQEITHIILSSERVE